MTQAWNNSDGLYIKYGQDEATVGKAGEFSTLGDERQIYVELDLTTLGATDGGTIVDDNVWIPAGAFIQKVKVVNRVASTGTGATLNLGLIKKDRSTEIDYNGLLAAAPRTDFDAIGETKEYSAGVSGAGALMGTATTYVGYLTADYDTAAFTAGKVGITIYYSWTLQA